ncbi:MAG: DNA-formamidopyrimidine glycosylase [Candidatus Pacebacteria bacterium]|nr:DNA-formamidopyrimidine glycosylase [Candidatus Paceibacterota bacterium]
MPELPEVETIVRDLNAKIRKRIFVDVWTDSPKIIKKPENFELFKKGLKGRGIENIRRRGKNIIFNLSDGKVLLVHQKLTGHFLLGKWQKTNNHWIPPKGPLSDKINTYIHLIFFLDNGKMLALSDLRKFAKAELWDKGELENSKEFNLLGPEPLSPSFAFNDFKERFKGKKGKIKKILMDQRLLVGIGNIYSDEILFAAKISPLRDVSQLSEFELKRIYKATKKILSLAIRLGGESFSDYRRIDGEKGYYDKARKVYRKTGEPCPGRCGGVVKRIKIDGRSAHYCPSCQK